MQDHTRL